MSLNTFLQSAYPPAGCQLGSEHGLAGRGKHKTVIEMDKSQLTMYWSKLKGLPNKQLNKDKLNGMYRGIHAIKLFVVE